MEGLWKLGRPAWGVRTLTQQGGIGTKLEGGVKQPCSTFAPSVVLPGLQFQYFKNERKLYEWGSLHSMQKRIRN